MLICHLCVSSLVKCLLRSIFKIRQFVFLFDFYEFYMFFIIAFCHNVPFEHIFSYSVANLVTLLLDHLDLLLCYFLGVLEFSFLHLGLLFILN